MPINDASQLIIWIHVCMQTFWMHICCCLILLFIYQMGIENGFGVRGSPPPPPSKSSKLQLCQKSVTKNVLAVCQNNNDTSGKFLICPRRHEDRKKKQKIWKYAFPNGLSWEFQTFRISRYDIKDELSAKTKSLSTPLFEITPYNYSTYKNAHFMASNWSFTSITACRHFKCRYACRLPHFCIFLQKVCLLTLNHAMKVVT